MLDFKFIELELDKLKYWKNCRRFLCNKEFFRIRFKINFLYTCTSLQFKNFSISSSRCKEFFKSI